MLQSQHPAGSLRPLLYELERTLMAPADPLPELRRLAARADLALLFELELGVLVRHGPEAAPLGPRALVASAWSAAGAGLLPLATPTALRRSLEALAADLDAVWDPATPLWWSPLPPPTSLESLWTSIDQGAGSPLRPPSRATLAAAFAGPDAPLWLALSDFLAPGYARAVWCELEAARARGELALERAGVGAGAELTARQADSVRYLTGREPELLAAAPSLAVLVQWVLDRLPERLQVDPGRRLFSPQRVMVARHPAPSTGYAAHLDNPGGAADNHRALTLVLDLTAPGEECAGGELAIWAPGTRPTSPPAEILAPRGGSAVVFDARAVAHQVQPLKPGPARWAMTTWLSDVPQAPFDPPSIPPHDKGRLIPPRSHPKGGRPRPSQPPIAVRPELRLGRTDVLLPIAAPPLRPGVVLFHQLSDERPAGEIVVLRATGDRPRVGIVATVYRGGTDLDAWCAYHFELGIDHLVLVFDHLEEEAEAADAARLRAAHPERRLTLWAGEKMPARWQQLPPDARPEDLVRFAATGSSCYAVASRQTLNASVALAAARGDELGGAPLDWLLHLDGDELFHLDGRGRGGGTVGEHFAAAGAGGLALVRYVNHELLEPRRPGSALRFKLNPRLAVARLGRVGWEKLVAQLGMAQTDPRPYFRGYFNGKSAVAVARGRAAAGVHGWYLTTSEPEQQAFVAGPSVLHLHFASAEAFRRKYVAAAAVPQGPRPFAPSPAEVEATELIRSLREEGADEATVARRLDELHRTMTRFTAADVELLEAAGLIVSADSALASLRGEAGISPPYAARFASQGGGQ